MKLKILSVKQQRSLVEFQLDTHKRLLNGMLTVDFDRYVKHFHKAEYDLIGAAALLVVAGLFVPSSIIVEWDSEASMLPEFNDLLRILYDVRAYCSKTAPFLPTVSIKSSNKIQNVQNAEVIFPAIDLDILNYSHILLFSGGIDSTYSMLRLIEEGSKSIALFLGINTDTVELEWEASRRIASTLDIELLHCDFVLKGFPQRGVDHANWPQFGQFPYFNSIPHGRDILSAALASVIARRFKIDSIAFGQEKESREKVIPYHGRRILRHDVESFEGSTILKTWLRRCLQHEIQLISPVESLTIEQIRLDMLDRYPDIMAMTQSCFWERRCCQCAKCVSSYILQRLTGNNIFNFQKNPLADQQNRDLADAIDSDIPDNEIGYGAQIRNGIRSIITKGKYTAEDYWVIRALENPIFQSLTPIFTEWELRIVTQFYTL
jgi:7-cyano-7-deazaguanine synthase in queuosine biosynthesis